MNKIYEVDQIYIHRKVHPRNTKYIFSSSSMLKYLSELFNSWLKSKTPQILSDQKYMEHIT